jgi:methionyl-tRNA formyltransferase
VRALFFGTPAIAVPSLEALASFAEVVGVVCQPDKPAGRGLQLQAPPVKERALALGFEVVQPTKVRVPEFAQWVRDRNADVALVIAYGRILPLAVLEAPRRGCMNLHASILPKYRGAAPITWAIVNGETETGVALMQMDEGMDTGAVFSTHTCPIGENTTADELGVTLGELAASVVRADLLRAISGELTTTAQEHDKATMAPILDKANGLVDFNKPARKVHDHARGMTSWPGAFTTANSKRLVLLSTRVVREGASEAPPGTVVRADKGGVEIACGDGAIALLTGQVEGKKPLAARELVGGRALVAGMLLG